MSDYPHIERLESDLNDHGHVHVIAAERPGPDGELDLSIGTGEFHYDDGVITVDSHDDLWRVAMDDVVAWYLPSSV